MQRFLRKIYGYAFLDDLILIYPVYALLFRESGLSALQIGSVFAVWSLIPILFEVPTGMLADTYSRKKILIIAQVMKAAGYALWLGQTYATFVLGIALWGIAEALVSGTLESFIYDALKQEHKEETYEKVNGRVRFAHFAGIVCAVLLGGVAAQQSYVLALWPSVIIPLAASLLMVFTPTVHKAISTGERKYWHILGSAFREARRNPRLLKLMVYMALIFGVIGAGDEYWGLFYEDIGISLAMMGVFFAVANGIAALGGLTAHRWGNSDRSTYLLIIIASVSFLLFAFLRSPAAIPLSFLAAYTVAVAQTKMEAALQHLIASDQRATVTSMNRLLLEAVALLFYLVVGFLAGEHGIVIFLWLMGGMGIVITLAFLPWENLRNN